MIRLQSRYFCVVSFAHRDDNTLEMAIAMTIDTTLEIEMQMAI